MSRPGAAYTYRAALAAALVILGVTAVSVALIGPYTTWFRRQSTPGNPAGMQHAVHARFANGVELIGYNLLQPAVRQGETMGVRLYWRTWAPKASNARPFLHLDAATGEVTWANQTKLNAGDKPMLSWPPGFFVVDDYRLPVGAATPAVVGQLRAGLLGPGGEHVSLADGGELAALGPVRVTDRAPRQAANLPNREQAYQLGPAVRLAGHEVRPVADPPGIEVTLYWQALATVPADYTAFVHVRDAAGRTIGQQDGPPMHGWYPTSAWAPGQVISDTYIIPLPAAVPAGNLRIAAGLYTPADGQRAPVTDGRGVRQANDEIILPVEAD